MAVTCKDRHGRNRSASLSAATRCHVIMSASAPFAVQCAPSSRYLVAVAYSSLDLHRRHVADRETIGVKGVVAFLHTNLDAILLPDVASDILLGCDALKNET